MIGRFLAARAARDLTRTSGFVGDVRLCELAQAMSDELTIITAALRAEASP